MRGKTLAGLLLLGLLTLALGVAAQEPPPPPPKQESQQEKAKPPKKAKKVWTEEDLKNLRRPSDEYLEKKRAAEEAAKAAEDKSKEAGAEEEAPQNPIDPATGKPYLDPDSPEYLEKRIKDYEQAIVQTRELAEQARDEMNSASDQDRWELAKVKLETYEANIVDLEQKLKEAKAKLAEMGKSEKAPAQPAPAPPQP